MASIPPRLPLIKSLWLACQSRFSATNLKTKKNKEASEKGPRALLYADKVSA